MGLEADDCRGHLSIVNSMSYSRNEFELIRVLLSCWKQSSDIGYTTVIKGWTCSATGRLWCLYDTQPVLRSPKCGKKLSLTALNHQQQPKLLIQGRQGPSFRAHTFCTHRYIHENLMIFKGFFVYLFSLVIFACSK